ncbi:MAG: type II secretion system GspH family protein [Microthrixaceae bacterium]|nr:type II secretion system GspH family protein [Microthrixaceae bacterium]
MRNASTRRTRGSGGFTLIEVLISTAMLALVGVALTAVSLTFVVQVNDAARNRQGNATTAQWSSMAFARDVQGAAGVTKECDPASKSTHLVTLRLRRTRPTRSNTGIQTAGHTG